MVVDISGFDQYISTQTYQVPVLGFLINILLAILLSGITSYVYIRFGRSLSNRRSFAHNFVIIGLTTMFIITVVKSSLALSLGLVGALSIVRFRTAIKDPEELAFLLITIAIGLGLGADQRVISVIAVLAILGVIIIRSQLLQKNHHEQVMQVLITGKGDDHPSLEQITSVVRKHGNTVHLKRFDINSREIEILYFVEFNTFDELKNLADEVTALSRNLTVTYLDSVSG
jgi:uncharacterized membrane protein YhiD involved in acid resistance